MQIEMPASTQRAAGAATTVFRSQGSRLRRSVGLETHRKPITRDRWMSAYELAGLAVLFVLSDHAARRRYS
jgi:hypothetical protein